jgi:hypothetical protein
MPQIIQFPGSPSYLIAKQVASCPALGAVADRLPSIDDSSRLSSERIMVKLFRRLLHPLKLLREESDQLLDHGASPDAFVVDELAVLATDKETECVYEYWKEIWESEDDPVLQDRARYFAALVARLYRLENIVLAEAGRC